jgi:hypothetical protein
MVAAQQSPRNESAPLDVSTTKKESFMRFSRKAKIGVIGVVISMGIGIGAYAFWTQGGTGTGAATTGGTTGITVVQDSTTASTLYPGGPAEALSGHFVNTNSGDVSITSVTAVVTSTTSAGDTTKPACTTEDFAIGGTSGPYLVASGSTTTWSGLTVSLTNTAFNQDNCKGATIGITYTAA